MTNIEFRQLDALEGIAKSVKDLTKVMVALNENFVIFSKQMLAADTAYNQAMSERGPMMVLREEAVDQLTLDEFESNCGCHIAPCDLHKKVTDVEK